MIARIIGGGLAYFAVVSADGFVFGVLRNFFPADR